MRTLFATWMLCLLSLCCWAGRKDFSIVGVWMLKSETAPDGRMTPSIYTQYTRCKIYDSDSTYYTVQLHAVGDDMLIIAHEMGKYRLNDSVYMERDRVMPFHVIDDTTFITEFNGYQELMVRSNTMTEERKEEIRQLVRKYPDESEAPVKHYVLSTTERKLKNERALFLYIIMCMSVVAVGVAVYVYRLRKRKREIEKKLAEIEEERALRPVVVADAMKQVETEFYQSDYYMALRRRIEAGENIKPTEWKELERQLKVVYPHFSSSLYSLYNLSPIEWQVCMLLKIRTAPVEIATVLNKDKSTISTTRRRLYKKVFGKDGSGKDWDEFILSL
ncbi:MAG: hypothetical protein J5924_02560 [Bacteroidaceae bacterium]|jgi:hypothetical protein|nr:hypothetical protein [Bacteroidaceae bacterium]